MTCCSNPASFSNNEPPNFGEEANISFTVHDYGDGNPITLEEIEERSLNPVSDQNILAETVAPPMPITGAPLTCIVSANNETFCRMEEGESELDVNWSVYNEQEEMIASESYEVQSLPSDSYWDIKIIFNEPIKQISVEASNLDEEIDDDGEKIAQKIEKKKKKKKKAKAKSKVHTDHNFEQMLTGTYTSPQWGELELVVNPDLTVSGTYAIKSLTGSLEGTLNLTEASISGTWEEHNRKGKLKHSGEVVFNIVFEGQEKFHIDGSYVNEGDDKWHDWDLFPKNNEQNASLYAL